MSARPQPLDLLIFGSPRSGTTLVQRLCIELDGVAIPPETHFFSVFVPERKWRFPLSTPRLRHHLEAYADLGITPLGGADIEPIIEALEGTAANPFEVFAALVHQLAGPADLVGEKTPHHLLWWRPLSRAFPRSKLVWVVRDPRAVVESNLRMPWGMNSVATLAAMWRSDQDVLLAAKASLGDRILILRYEDLVAEPEGAQGTLATHIGHDRVKRASAVEMGEVAIRREHWKSDVIGPIHSDRATHWKQQLTEQTVSLIESICGAQMRALDYPSAAASAHHNDPRDALRARRVRWSRRRRLHSIDRIERQHLGRPPSSPPATDSSAADGQYR